MRKHLLARFLASHRIKIAHHTRIRAWASGGANNIKSIFNITHPVAHRFVECIFQGFRTRANWHHFSAKQFHAEHIDGLPLNIHRAHIHHTLQAQTRRHGGRGHTVLAGTGFGNHPGFAHALGQHGLANGVVNLVRTGVV